MTNILAVFKQKMSLENARVQFFMFHIMHSCSISTFTTSHFLNVYFRIFLHPDGFHENDSKTVQRSAFCRSRRELSNEYLLAKIGFDTAENEPLKVWITDHTFDHIPSVFTCKNRLRYSRERAAQSLDHRSHF